MASLVFFCKNKNSHGNSRVFLGSHFDCKFRQSPETGRRYLLIAVRHSAELLKGDRPKTSAVKGMPFDCVYLCKRGAAAAVKGKAQLMTLSPGLAWPKRCVSHYCVCLAEAHVRVYIELRINSMPTLTLTTLCSTIPSRQCGRYVDSFYNVFDTHTCVFNCLERICNIS